MSSRHHQLSCLVLGYQDQGESHRRYRLLSADEGPLEALWRRSQKRAARSAPDLFQSIDAELEKGSRGGKACFLRDFRVRQAHPGIALHYASFREASRFLQTLWRNLTHMETFQAVYALATDALAAFARGEHPGAVHFKALYLLARREGYPVKEEWWAQLPAGDQGAVVHLLQTPPPEIELSTEEERRLLGLLENYLRGHSDIIVPA